MQLRQERNVMASRASSALISTPFFQPKLTVNTPGDAYEQEADQVAERVMGMQPGEAAQPQALSLTPVAPVQRQCTECEKEELQRQEEDSEEKEVQRMHIASNADDTIQRQCAACEQEEAQRKENGGGDASGKAAPGIVNDVLSSGGGQAMDGGTRQFMESRFGHDFGQVRIHTDSRAAESATAIQAKAYTSGRDIVFGQGQYQPESDSGKRLLAHELAHTIQQNVGNTFQRQAIPDHELPPFEPGQTMEGVLDDPLVEPVTSNTPLTFDAQDTTHISLDGECPRRANLGAVEPSPECPVGEDDFDGKPFTFCPNSDVLNPSEQLSEMITFVRQQPAFSTFNVAGYASKEGLPANNWNLACHRAKRVALILQNAGVRSEKLTVVNRGVTERFGSGSREENLRKNRVVVVQVQADPQQSLPTELPTNRREIVELARNRIISGGYNLGADAYLSFWTCGQVPTLARAVERTTVMIEGEPNTPTITRQGLQSSIGNPRAEGLNTIILSNEMFDNSFNVLECIIARIIDLAVHHAVRPNIPAHGDAHKAGMYIVHLAGFGACLQKTATMVNGELVSVAGLPFTSTVPLTTDPRQDGSPSCANQALPGALATASIAGIRPVPNFSVTNFNLNSNNQPADVSLSRVGVEVSAPSRFLSGEADVHATGNTSDIANYQLGFIQSLVEHSETEEYASGHQFHTDLPVPLLDGPPRRLGAPRPWFHPAAVFAASTGNVHAIILDAPVVRAPRFYLDIPHSVLEPMQISDNGQVTRERLSFQNNNPIIRLNARYVFHTWLAARRNDAPLDRFSTHFLRGGIWTLNMNADFIGSRGSGTANLQSSLSTDSSQMQMRDPVPNDVAGRPAATISFDNPPDRAQANGRSLRDYIDEVRRIAQPIRLRHGLNDQLTIRIKIDRQTGRIRLATPGSTPPVSIETNSGTDATREACRVELLENLRRDMVLAPLSGHSENLETVPVTMPAVGTDRR